MAFHVRDPDTDRVVRALAEAKGTTITNAIRNACARALADLEEDDRERRHAQMRAIRAEIASYPSTNVTIDKAFFDSLNDE